MSTVIGGAMLPHAPQFFTMPETEDKAVVAHVREVAADIGRRLRALNPDLWIIFSNDHAEQFFHTTAPPFTIHVGGEASGDFAGRKFHWKIPSEIGFELVRQLYRHSHRRPRSTMPSAFRSPTLATPDRFCRFT
jgi:2,3-dihydroxyphenylpropionate 1,2-dioxygenase